MVTTTVTVVFSQESIIQMTSLKVFPCRTGMGNPNQCSTSYLASSWVYYNHTFMLGNNGHLHNMCLHPHMGWNVFITSIYIITCMPVYCTDLVFRAIFIINTTHSTQKVMFMWKYTWRSKSKWLKIRNVLWLLIFNPSIRVHNYINELGKKNKLMTALRCIWLYFANRIHDTLHWDCIKCT